jgi:hypothetical protein
VRVVTEHGAPTRTAAPALPARAAATSATRPGQGVRENVRPVAPVERTAPAVNRSVPAVQRSAPAAAAEQPKRLDSSRFAHPQGNVVPPAQPLRTTPSREVERKVPAVKPPPKDEKQDHGSFRGNVPATTSRGNPPGASTSRPEYRAPERKVQEYHPPVQSQPTYHAPERNVQENRAPQRSVQEYRAPVQQPRQERPAPQKNVQQYQQRQAPTVQRNAPAPQERKKDDKNDKDGHH